MTEKLKQIKQIYDFDFCPVVFTVDLPECKTVWLEAKKLTDYEYPDFTAHSWRLGENNKQILVYSLDNYHDAILCFWKNLEIAAGKKWKNYKQYFVELSSEEVSELNQK